MIAFLFPGQGSQYVGMGKALAESHPVAGRYFEEANQTLGYDLKKLCFCGPETELNQTIHTQPAILTVSVAVWAILSDKGVKANLLAGHSLGEYTALVAAGVLSFEQALSLVQNRARFMRQAVPEGQGAMAAIVGLGRDKVIGLCQEYSYPDVVEAVNFNCPGQVVISGSHSTVSKAMGEAKLRGAKLVKQLPLSIPSHCSLMRGVGDKLAEELEGLILNEAKIPIVTNVTAKPVTSAEEIKKTLAKQVYSPVLWEDSIQYMIDQGTNTFVESGPGNVLTKLMRRINRNVRTLQVEDEENLQNTLAVLEKEQR